MFSKILLAGITAPTHGAGAMHINGGRMMKTILFGLMASITILQGAYAAAANGVTCDLEISLDGQPLLTEQILVNKPARITTYCSDLACGYRDFSYHTETIRRVTGVQSPRGLEDVGVYLIVHNAGIYASLEVFRGDLVPGSEEYLNSIQRGDFVKTHVDATGITEPGFHQVEVASSNQGSSLGYKAFITCQ